MFDVSDEPPPYMDGVRINSPHYLAKLILPEGSAERDFTLVVSQYEKTVTIYYTLRVYATSPFRLDNIIDPFKYSEKVSYAVDMVRFITISLQVYF